jgi:hypothetical protein
MRNIPEKMIVKKKNNQNTILGISAERQTIHVIHHYGKSCTRYKTTIMTSRFSAMGNTGFVLGKQCRERCEKHPDGVKRNLKR